MCVDDVWLEIAKRERERERDERTDDIVTSSSSKKKSGGEKGLHETNPTTKRRARFDFEFLPEILRFSLSIFNPHVRGQRVGRSVSDR